MPVKSTEVYQSVEVCCLSSSIWNFSDPAVAVWFILSSCGYSKYGVTAVCWNMVYSAMYVYNVGMGEQTALQQQLSLWLQLLLQRIMYEVYKGV